MACGVLRASGDWIKGRPPAPPCPRSLSVPQVEENPVPLRMVHGHMHSALGEWLGEFTDIREELNTIPNKKLRKKAVEVCCCPSGRPENCFAGGGGGGGWHGRPAKEGGEGSRNGLPCRALCFV